jgi:two-component sensor histidine kinase
VVVRKDGTRAFVDIRGSVVEYAGQKILQGNFRDVTEKKQAEEALKNHRDNLEKMVEERTSALDRVVSELEGEVGERSRAEDALRESLREKDLLLRELSHRVNNNLQLISSLLDMSGTRSASSEAQGLIRDCRARVEAMAFIHSELYQGGSIDRVNLGRIAYTLTQHLVRAYGKEGVRVFPKIESEGVTLPLIKAIPCALVINELLTNALKHAFVGRAEGKVELQISELADGTVRTLVHDDGVGVPADVDLSGAESLGLNLVRNLVERQLKGTFELHRGEGTVFCVEFPRGEDHGVQ